MHYPGKICKKIKKQTLCICCGSAQKRPCAVYYEYPRREKRPEIWVIFLESFPESNWTRKRKCDIMDANFGSQNLRRMVFVGRRKNAANNRC